VKKKAYATPTARRAEIRSGETMVILSFCTASLNDWETEETLGTETVAGSDGDVYLVW
jgi:hypothetical protein